MRGEGGLVCEIWAVLASLPPQLYTPTLMRTILVQMIEAPAHARGPHDCPGALCPRLLPSRPPPPPPRRFKLLTKIRLARGCATLEGRRHVIRVRLMSLWLAFHSSLLSGESRA